MRPLRELKSDVWYEIRTAANNREPLFRLRQTLALFAQVLEGTAERFSFEIRALRLEGYRLVFYIRPKDGLQLPRIMQWLKQTFGVRYNLRHGRTGHIWGDRYWSEILEGEPPEEAEKWSGAVMGVEAAELSPVEARVRPLSGRVSPLSRKTGIGVRPIQKKPAKNPRRVTAMPI
jgi:hypothetical protein